MIPKITDKTVIVAALCWGLGHATRCIPIIRHLAENGNKVIMASDSEALTLLRAEFPNLPTIDLPPYNISYPTSSMIYNMATQSPQILAAIRTEHKMIERIAHNQRIDIIISDNRLGCYSTITKNIYLTHQVTIPHKFWPIRFLASRAHRTYINQYDECWIPDYQDKDSLAGCLTKGSIKPAKIFVGPLSRLQLCSTDTTYDLTAILSGPEPQRTYLERDLLAIFETLSHLNICLIRGTNEISLRASPPSQHVTIHNRLGSTTVNKILCQSREIICRAGYSSIMDIVKINKPAILIPTPGQYEQVYLARHLEGQYGFRSLQQSNLPELPSLLS